MRGTIRLLYFSFLVFAIHLGLTHDAQAVYGQIYSGDGATINSTVPPGGWIVSGGFFCLDCHGPNAVPPFNGPDKTSYLMTGHKNALRVTQETPTPLTGPDGQPYSTDLFGNTFNWTDNAINIIGYCTSSAFMDQSSCVTGGAVWISGTKDLYYIFAGWMGGAAPMALYDGSYIQGTQKTAVSYSCGRCHTTGYTMDTALKTRNPRDPDAIFPGLTWTPSRTTGVIDFDPDGNGPAIAGSWAFEGIECERCHDATNHPTAGKATVVSGAAATALCLNCHRQEHTLAYTSGGLGANIVPTAYTDNASLPAAEPFYALPSIETGQNGAYALEFFGYSTGMEFLNSAHGQFTGNFQQIGDPSQYSSLFVINGTVGGGPGSGCTTCHDVHQSTVEAVGAASPFQKQCSDCHLEAQYLSNMRHPSGTGTPLGNLSDVPGACAICHMPRPNNGAGTPSHLWRINTDANYSTFPTETQWDAGQKTANTALSGTYSQAVWLDLDIACGQCHGGNGGYGNGNPGATKNGAPYFSKSYLAVVAQNMHNFTPLPRFTWLTDTVTSFKVNFDASATECPPATLGIGTCNYTWDFGDGGTGTGVSASHTYAGITPVTVTLTVDTNGTFNTTASTSLPVTPASVNHVPTASGLGSLALNSYTVSFTDTSTDAAGNYPFGFNSGAVTVLWGDGQISTGNQGAYFSHTYAAGTYVIRHTATDKAGLSNTETVSGVTAPQKFSITANTSPALSGVTMYLKQGTTTKATGTTGAGGNYIFTSVGSGTYTVTAYRSGYVFDGDAGTAGNQNPVTVTVGPNQTVTFTHTP